jgi:hypothetical protein
MDWAQFASQGWLATRYVALPWILLAAIVLWAGCCWIVDRIVK